MRFEYHGNTGPTLDTILGGRREFEDQVEQTSKTDEVTDVAVHPLTAGLSGAAVFLVRRIGRRGKLVPWVVKVCDNPDLIIAERKNNAAFVQSALAAAPGLVPNGSARLLIFRFGGHLADYNPKTLRAGYADSSAQALEALMRRIVTSLKPIHHLSDDVASCVDRMPLARMLDASLKDLDPSLPADVNARLTEGWAKALREKDTYSHVRSTGHGDLNSGNVLFEPGDVASHPVFIDFASMRRSKDNIEYPETYHLPFWDYAKLERDLQTRLFLGEALAAGIGEKAIVEAIRTVNGAGSAHKLSPSGPTSKLMATTRALREAVRNEYPPAIFAQTYRVVVAYAMTTVLFRGVPDTDVPHDLQQLAAAEAAIALLGAGELLPATREAKGSVESRHEGVVSSDQPSLTHDESTLVAHLFGAEGRCRIAAARGEYESLWCPGEMMDMQWGWERTKEEVAANGKAVGDRGERLRWLFVVRDLVGKGMLEPLPQTPGRRDKLFELTESGWRAGAAIAASRRGA